MKQGTSGFIGGRLRHAREARGLSAIGLADLIGVTRTAVYQYENDEQSPRPEVMEHISQVLNLPAAYFRYVPQYPEIGSIFYRSLSASTKTARLRAERRYDWLREIVGYVKKFVLLPPVNLPDINPSSNPTAIRRDEIEEIASQARLFWHLGDGPLKNVIGLLESNGIIVASDELGADTLDAFSDAKGMGDTPFVILGSDKAVAVRSRLDAIHELGHLILHHRVDRKRLNNKTEHALMEQQAFQFAGAFLFPAKTFAREFYSASLDSLKLMKPKWKVSIAMMIKRATELEFITAEQARRLWINYGRRGWKTREPLDDEIEIEQPSLSRLAFEIIAKNNPQASMDILGSLPYAASDIEALACLPPGFLGSQVVSKLEPAVHVLQDRRAKKHTKNDSQQLKAKIIRFPTQNPRKKLL